jgi:hypothetical protein
MNLCRPWPQGSRSCGVAVVADRVCYGGAYGRLPPPPSVVQKIPTLSVQARSREALLRKTRTSPSWPRRGRRGLRRRRRAFSHGGSRSYGGQGHSRIAKFVLLSSPEFEAPARTVGKYGREVERRPRNSYKEGPATDSGYRKLAPLPSIGEAEGTGGSYHGYRVREAGPPRSSLPLRIPDTPA